MIGMSAIGSKRPRRRMFAFGGKADMRDLFDHLVGMGEHCWWYCEAQCLSGFKIDHQIVLGRCLDRHVGRFLTLEDAVDVIGGASPSVPKTGSIRDQASIGDELVIEVDRGKSVAGRKLDDQIALSERYRARRHDQTAITRTRECSDCPLGLAGIA